MNATTIRLAVLAAAATLTIACGHEAVEELETTTAVPVTVEAATTGTIASVVSVAGIVTPAPGADLLITAPEAGRIAEMPKAEGDPVRAGDLLVRFDIPTLAADTSAKRAALKQAQARFETARANAARLAPLVERGVTAQRDLEEARRAQAEAEADIAQAESAVAAATALGARTVVRASFAGVVAKRWHNPGDLVEASASDPILRVINPHGLQIVAKVPLADLARFTPGRKGRALGPAGGEGDAITVLTRPAQVDPVTSLADVRIGFAGTSTLPAGASIVVEVVSDSRSNAIVIPTVAVLHEEEQAFVMIAGTDNKAHKKAVVTGLDSNGRVEIVSGVTAGELVIIQGQNELPDGAAIAINK
jgi:RND family efflux transporter MFP subunit